MPKRRLLFASVIVLIAVLAAAFMLTEYLNERPSQTLTDNAENNNYEEDDNIYTSAADKKIAAYASKHNISVGEYPESLRELLERNPETEKFVLEYPLKKDTVATFDMNDYCGGDTVPLLMQWDQKWGYSVYGSDVLGITGCGPTCLSMVALYLLGDADMTPARIAAFSTENGYCIPGNGTSWTLMSDGARTLGLDVTELPLDKDRMVRNLEVGNPIICVMGPGDFTDSGHYIVITGYTDGKFTVNDPNSIERSHKLWDYDDIKDQIRNIWTYRVIG